MVLIPAMYSSPLKGAFESGGFRLVIDFLVKLFELFVPGSSVPKK